MSGQGLAGPLHTEPPPRAATSLTWFICNPAAPPPHLYPSAHVQNAPSPLLSNTICAHPNRPH